jgi:hypothetical protein
MTDLPTKITFAELRDMGVCGILVYCADFRCSHCVAMSADEWPDDVRLSDIEPRFVCKACGKRGADVRPDFGKPVEPRAIIGIGGLDYERSWWTRGNAASRCCALARSGRDRHNQHRRHRRHERAWRFDRCARRRSRSDRQPYRRRRRYDRDERRGAQRSF